MRDWRELRLRVCISVEPDVVFRYWVRPDLLGQWFVTASHQSSSGRLLEKDVEAGEGFRYRWTWANGVTEEGEFTQVQGPALIAFTFGKDVGVVVRIATFEGRTVVELLQTHGHASEEAKASCYIDCLQGWTFYLTNLKSVLEGGIDLRETQTDLADLVNI